MFSMNQIWLLRPAFLFLCIGMTYLFLLKACGGETARTTNYVATIRVDGREYTSDVVLKLHTAGAMSYTGGLYPGHYGLVLTFRLSDDRVVVLNTHPLVERAKCAPRLDKSDTGCEKRWSLSWGHFHPDGYVFNNAENPTYVEAFQFEPRSPHFAPDGKYDLDGQATPKADQIGEPIYVSTLKIEMVSFAEHEKTRFTSERDTLDRDFPGNTKLREKHHEKTYQYLNPALSKTANRVRIPSAKHRR